MLSSFKNPRAQIRERSFNDKIQDTLGKEARLNLDKVVELVSHQLGLKSALAVPWCSCGRFILNPRGTGDQTQTLSRVKPTFAH